VGRPRVVRHVNRPATGPDGAADRRVHPLFPPGYVLPRPGPLESDRQSVHRRALLASKPLTEGTDSGNNSGLLARPAGLREGACVGVHSGRPRIATVTIQRQLREGRLADLTRGPRDRWHAGAGEDSNYGPVDQETNPG